MCGLKAAVLHVFCASLTPDSAEWCMLHAEPRVSSTPRTKHVGNAAGAGVGGFFAASRCPGRGEDEWRRGPYGFGVWARRCVQAVVHTTRSDPAQEPIKMEIPFSP
eukprot:3053009-Prymnesium_polylepis.1